MGNKKEDRSKREAAKHPKDKNYVPKAGPKSKTSTSTQSSSKKSGGTK